MNEDLALAALEQLPCGVLVASPQRVVWVNAWAAQLLGTPPPVVVERQLEQCFVASQRTRVGQAAQAVWQQGSAPESPELLELVAQRSDGSTIIVDARLGGLWHRGERLVVLMLTDAWDRLRAVGSLARLAFEDTVTGLPNRASFTDAVTKALQLSKRHGDGFAIGVLDLDGFKAVNDEAGHDVGDVVLREIGARLRAAVREPDFVARLGGDEFTLLLPGVRDESAALRVAGAVQRAMSDPLVVGQRAFSVGASLGLALFPHHGRDLHSLLVAADTAMYAGKRQGRGSARVFDGASPDLPSERAVDFHWTLQFETGVELIDQQHRGLLAALVGLVEALSSAEAEASVRERMAGLSVLAATHFATEESVMRARNFPGLAQHAAEHRSLLHELASIGETFEQRGLSQSVQLVRDWFLIHLNETDSELSGLG
jgi:diguanylate cyclase (GGDEF)-like protein/hemerythrin-like metal-binding protein